MNNFNSLDGGFVAERRISSRDRRGAVSVTLLRRDATTLYRVVAPSHRREGSDLDLAADRAVSTRKHVRELRRLMTPLGWRIAGHTGGGHLRLVKAGCPAVTISATPSCPRWRANALGIVRRIDQMASLG